MGASKNGGQFKWGNDKPVELKPTVLGGECLFYSYMKHLGEWTTANCEINGKVACRRGKWSEPFRVKK